MRFIITTWALGVAFILAMAMPALAENDSYSRTIKVSGESEVKIVPDQAVIIIGVESMDKSMTAAKSLNDDQVKNVADIAARYGVGHSDIGTEYMSISTRFGDPYKEKKLIGYNVRRTMVVTLNDVSKFDSLLGDLLEGGVRDVQSVRFQTTELRQCKDQARSMAIKAASEKAQALAAELGMKVGKAKSIVEKTSDYRSFYGRWGNWYYGTGGPNPFNSSMTVEQPLRDDIPVVLGKISISAGIEVVFELE
jgi:uncharacterized protein YggE